MEGGEVLLNVRRDRVIDRPESREAGEAIGPRDASVHVHHAERPLAQPRVYPLLQVVDHRVDIEPT